MAAVAKEITPTVNIDRVADELMERNDDDSEAIFPEIMKAMVPKIELKGRCRGGRSLIQCLALKYDLNYDTLLYVNISPDLVRMFFSNVSPPITVLSPDVFFKC